MCISTFSGALAPGPYAVERAWSFLASRVKQCPRAAASRSSACMDCMVMVANTNDDTSAHFAFAAGNCSQTSQQWVPAIAGLDGGRDGELSLLLKPIEGRIC